MSEAETKGIPLNFLTLNQIKSNTSMIIVALTLGVSRPLSIMNFKCNVSFLRYENLKKNYASITK